MQTRNGCFAACCLSILLRSQVRMLLLSHLPCNIKHNPTLSPVFLFFPSFQASLSPQSVCLVVRCYCCLASFQMHSPLGHRPRAFASLHSTSCPKQGSSTTKITYLTCKTHTPTMVQQRFPKTIHNILLSPPLYHPQAVDLANHTGRRARRRERIYPPKN